MGMFDFFTKKEKFNPTESLNQTLYDPYFISGTPLNEPRNLKTDLIQGYIDNEIIYAIVNKIAGTASMIPLELFKDETLITNHWINDILSQPNPDNTFQELLFSYYVYYLSIGNSYLYSNMITDLDNNIKTREVKIMPAEEVQIIKGDWQEPIRGYRIMSGQQKYQDIDKSNVMHGKQFNPRFQQGEWLYGLSPIQVADEIISSYNDGVNSLSKAYKNGGPSYSLSPKELITMSTVEKENWISTFKQKYSGTDNAGKVMFSSIPLTKLELGHSIVDLNIIEANREALRTMCSVYGVSSILFNDNENSTYNNMDLAFKGFYEQSVMPLNEQFAQKFLHFLLPENTDNLSLRFNYSEVPVLQITTDDNPEEDKKELEEDVTI